MDHPIEQPSERDIRKRRLRHAGDFHEVAATRRGDGKTNQRAAHVRHLSRDTRADGAVTAHAVEDVVGA